MNRLPGNDFAKQFDKVEGSLETEAIMALAFEQRTANLINLMRLQSDYVRAGVGMTSEAAEEIEQRLGLGGKEESNG